MKILKFGGTSVGNAANIKKVAAIIKETMDSEHCIVVVSAMQSTTDGLAEAGRIAEKGGDGFYNTIKQIKERHVEALNELFPDGRASNLLEFLDSSTKELTETCEGVRLVARIIGPHTRPHIKLWRDHFKQDAFRLSRIERM